MYVINSNAARKCTQPLHTDGSNQSATLQGRSTVGFFIQPGEMTGNELTHVRIDIAIQLPRKVKIQHISFSQVAIFCYRNCIRYIYAESTFTMITEW